ncbi:MAG: hypothetical protein HY301_11520 [Verrucomicrobia bacterium]|nr:hypothetical protein [Verrucomicrobiota bacterium]
MTKVKLSLSRKNLDEKLQLCLAFETNMAGNADTPTPEPPLATLTAKRTALETKRNDRAQKQAELDALDSELEQDEEELTELLRQEGAYIQTATGGHPEKILGTGADIASPRSPSPATPAVQNLAARANGMEAMLHFKWDSSGRSYTYEFQITLDPNLPDGWTHAGTTRKSRLDAEDLTSGKKTWGRVRAIGPNGPGPWSDPACAMVP